MSSGSRGTAEGRRRNSATPEIVCLGEVFLDIVFTGIQEPLALGREIYAADVTLGVGGGAAITAVALTRLGAHARLVAEIGSDPLSHLWLAMLRDLGLDPSDVVAAHGKRMNVTAALSAADDRAFVTFLGGSKRVPSLPPVLAPGTHVHLAGGDPETISEVIREARRTSSTVSVDIGWHQASTYGATLLESLSGSTIILPNLPEALMITGTSTAEDALRVLATQCELPVITCGPDGAKALFQGRVLECPPPAVEVVDTTGAGDNFNAGFLYAFTSGETIERCLALGNACGALSTTVRGGCIDSMTAMAALEISGMTRIGH